MKVTTVAAQKGGAGKSTTVIHLGVELERLGQGPVCLVDLDEQGSLTKWAKRRNDTDATAPAFLLTTVEKLPAHLEWLRGQGFKHVVIDTPGRVSQETAVALKAADLVIVPTRPSPLDLDALGPTIREVCDTAKPLVFLVNAAMKRTRIANDTLMALSQHGRVIPTFLGSRLDFVEPLATGRTAQEVDPDGTSAFEVRKMAKYIIEQLGTQ